MFYLRNTTLAEAMRRDVAVYEAANGTPPDIALAIVSPFGARTVAMAIYGGERKRLKFMTYEVPNGTLNAQVEEAAQKLNIQSIGEVHLSARGRENEQNIERDSRAS